MKEKFFNLIETLKAKFSSAWQRFKTFELNTDIYTFTLVYSFLTLILYNTGFFKSIYLIKHNWVAVVACFIIVLCAYNTIFTILFQRKITKFFAVLLFLINATALYFMKTYNVAIDDVMLLNVLETDTKETMELLTFKLFAYIFFLGIMPAILIVKTKIKRPKIIKELLIKIAVALVSLFIGCSIIVVGYKSFSSGVRNNRALKHTLLPFNYFEGNFNLIKRALRKATNNKFNDLTADTVLQHKATNGKKNLVIFVVGEAARAQNFSLGGYAKDTNSALAGQELIYFNNFWSCGTATAVSVPCMFSRFPRGSYDTEKKSYSNLLDFLAKVDFNILWRDNNSSCKGVCIRVPSENLVNDKNPKYCNSKECYDEVLLDGLKERIDGFSSENNLIVLHQKGSHGPAYYLRYPSAFEKYKPVCASGYFEECEREEIINSYDNTIHYTSFFLNSAIELLKSKSSEFNVALVYVSDHGQSLGEGGVYLHAAPYRFAPEGQKHIPFFLWFSEDFKKEYSIDEDCLKAMVNEELSHDNIFHSMLGLFGVKTSHYEEKLDIFKNCRVVNID